MSSRSAKLGEVSGTGEIRGLEERAGGLKGGIGLFIFPQGTSVAEAEEFDGKIVPFEGWMRDPHQGWHRVRTPVIVSFASLGSGRYTARLRLAGDPEELEG